MVKHLLILTILLSACGGKLTDEQKRKIKDEMNRSKIRRLSDADITEAAFALGRRLVALSPGQRDSLLATRSVRWKEIFQNDPTGNAIEKQIVEAYADADARRLGDNIQKVGKDSLLYTKPVVKELPDGSLRFDHAIGITMAQRQVILSID